MIRIINRVVYIFYNYTTCVYVLCVYVSGSVDTSIGSLWHVAVKICTDVLLMMDI